MLHGLGKLADTEAVTMGPKVTCIRSKSKLKGIRLPGLYIEELDSVKDVPGLSPGVASYDIRADVFELQSASCDVKQ